MTPLDAHILVGLCVLGSIVAMAWTISLAPTPQAKQEELMKWLDLVKNLAPFILAAVPGVPPVLIPAIVHGITVAEGIQGSTGVQKKAIVIDLVSTGLQTANAVAGKTVIDETSSVAAVSQGIDATVNAINAIHSATSANTATPPPAV